MGGVNLRLLAILYGADCCYHGHCRIGHGFQERLRERLFFNISSRLFPWLVSSNITPSAMHRKRLLQDVSRPYNG